MKDKKDKSNNKEYKITFLGNLGRIYPGCDEKEANSKIKSEIQEAFKSYRCFPFFIKENVLNIVSSFVKRDDLTTDEAMQKEKEILDILSTIRNQLIDDIADKDEFIKKSLLTNVDLSSTLLDSIKYIYIALAQMGNPSLNKRRFVIVVDRSPMPGIYYEKNKFLAISHVGFGPLQEEIPSIYLSINTIRTIKIREKSVSELISSKTLEIMLEIEERAIEIGGDYTEELPQEYLEVVDNLVDEILRASIVHIKPPEKIKRKYVPFSERLKNRIFNLLDARTPWDELRFDYEKNLKGIQLLERLARRYKQRDDRTSLKEVLRLVVAASGHDLHEVRNRANIIIDRILSPKEYDAPIATKFINTSPSKPVLLRFDLDNPSRTGTSTFYFLRLFSNYERNLTDNITTKSDISYYDVPLRFDEKESAYTVELRFDELGVFDYLVYKRQKNGNRIIRKEGCSGRINVIPDLRSEIILEIFPDIFGHTRLYWSNTDHPGLVYNENGEVIRLGRFSDITAHLEDLKKRYKITGLYILGIQKRGSNREDWAPQATSPSPFAPESLVEIEPSLGGEEEFRELVRKAHSLGIKVIVDMIPHVNRRSREVPDDWVVKCYDDSGVLVDRASTDGRYGSWNDGKLLNFRKLEVWEYIAGAVCQLIERYDIDGIRFDSAHAVPIMMKKNNFPFIYGRSRTHEQMVTGEIIVNDREEDHFITTGYYDSACREYLVNPFHYFLESIVSRKLKQLKKNFFIHIAECYWGREKVLSRSGVIPYNSALFKICEQIIHGQSDVRAIYHLYDNYYPTVLSSGSELIGILGNHDERRPVETFGREGLKAATMLTCFMHNIVLDYEGNPEGDVWKVYLDNIYVNWNTFESVSDRSIVGFYEDLYKFYRDNSGDGFLIWTNNNMVAGAIKVKENEIIVGAFNFSDETQGVYLQFDNPRLSIDEQGFYILEDPVYSPITNTYGYYTGLELKVSKIQTVVSYTDRYKILLLRKYPDPGEHYKDFLKDSFDRVCILEKPSFFKSNYAFLEIARNSEKYSSLRTFLKEKLIPILASRYKESSKEKLELGLKRIFYHLYLNGIRDSDLILKYFENMKKDEDFILRDLGNALEYHNRKGPIVFISAEAEPFSKMGGLANVVYELPREMVKLGEEVYVITPMYRYGDDKMVQKMKNSLHRYGVRFTGENVRFMIMDREYEVGVHMGIVDGVTYFLLDNHELFDGLYWGITSSEKLKKRIGFSRACVELMIRFALNPLFVFSNDAYTGIFNTIIKADSYYRNNPCFYRTSCIFVLHNAGWQYFDSYFRYENGFDLFSLFNLPHETYIGVSDPLDINKINLMAAGVRYADRVITVSPSYARQIKVASDGLELILKDVKGINNAISSDYPRKLKSHFRKSNFVEKTYPILIEKLSGLSSIRAKISERYPEILNGIKDCERIRDPRRRYIVTRMRNKLLLQVSFGLEVDPDRVLFTMIHRIVEQKGFQLLLESSEGIFKTLGFQGIVGGPVSWGDRRAEEITEGLNRLGDYYRGVVSVNIGFVDVSFPLLGSDVFLMPSLYEPGGISQLEAFSCGCLVVARATGGLRDTVVPIKVSKNKVEGNGFLFTDYQPQAFYDAMRRCKEFFEKSDEFTIYRARKKAERSVRYWDESAKEYIKNIYGLKEIIRPV